MDNNQPENKKLPFWDVIKTLILFIIAFAVVFFVAEKISTLFVQKPQSNQSPQNSQTSQATTTPETYVSCPPNYQSYQAISPSQSVDLIGSEIPTYAKNGSFVYPKAVITKIDTSTSNFACGYLLIQAGTKDHGPLQSWEDVVVNPDGFGGHLDSNSPLIISASDGPSNSQYLYLLSKIPYWRTIGHSDLLTADWAALLNVSTQLTFQIELNTTDPTGFIDKVTIAYKCWDPQTGQENTGCKLTVQK